MLQAAAVIAVCRGGEARAGGRRVGFAAHAAARARNAALVYTGVEGKEVVACCGWSATMVSTHLFLWEGDPVACLNRKANAWKT